MSNPTFLEELAARLYTQHGADELQQLQLLFPNRRAPLFFMKALSKASSKPLWAPGADSMEDFLFDQMGYIRLEKLDLLLLLYETHSSLGEEKGWQVQSFEHFSFWGEVILHDFNEIDAYLLSADKLFLHMSDLKEIDTRFAFLPEAHRALAERFWKHFLRDQGQHKELFLQLWKQLPILYDRLRKALLQRRQAYVGLLFRLLAEKPDTYPQLSKKRLLFVGFNQLSAAEQSFISYYIKHHQAQIHWDIDDFYMSHPVHEAARFFRGYQKHPVLGPTLPNPVPRHFQQPKKIQTQLSSHPISEVRAAVSHLQAYMRAHPQLDLERMAVILPEEEMLWPLLHALPKRAINISMGYRLSSTPLKDLVLMFLSIWPKREEGIPQSEWRQLLDHPYLSPFCESRATKEKNEEEKPPLHYIYSHTQDTRAPRFLYEALFEASELLEALDTLTTGWIQRANQVGETPYQLSLSLSEPLLEASPFSRLELTYFRTLQEMISSLRSSSISSLLEQMRPRSQRRLLENLLYQQQIPFTGEPLQGIQLMGILETRNLDFDCLVVLDLNEGSWPPLLRGSTLVAQPLRRAYGLPTYREQQASYAHHFYRLLHRSKEVLLVHLSSEQSATSTEKKQKSRYLYQLAYDNPHHRLQEVKPPYPSIRVPLLQVKSIQKTQELLDKWRYATQGPGFSYSMSASDLNTYLSCPLGFYYKCMLKLRPRVGADALSRMHLGRLFHQAIEKLYEPRVGRLLTESILEEANTEAQGLLKRLICKDFGLDPRLPLRGKPRLFEHVLLRYLRAVIAFDKQRARSTEGLCIRQLEGKLHRRLSISNTEGNSTFYFHGRADRIDESQGTYFIIDYKTGKSSPQQPSTEALFLSEKPYQYNHVRQISLYAWMCSHMFKRRSEALLFPLVSLHKQAPLTYVYAEEEIESRLKACVSELLDLSVAFGPPASAEQGLCEGCPHPELCRR